MQHSSFPIRTCAGQCRKEELSGKAKTGVATAAAEEAHAGKSSTFRTSSVPQPSRASNIRETVSVKSILRFSSAFLGQLPSPMRAVRPATGTASGFPVLSTLEDN